MRDTLTDLKEKFDEALAHVLLVRKKASHASPTVRVLSAFCPCSGCKSRQRSTNRFPALVMFSCTWL
jgi:hypothetical protein